MGYFDTKRKSLDTEYQSPGIWETYEHQMELRRLNERVRRAIGITCAAVWCLSIGIVLGIELERGWTAHNAEAVEVAK